ncbi:MAG TPA: SpoIIE family protein phosphatase, partial [Nocardioidaceae bacterium]|nr:SpoIIE family protein phosphatase [Nocardioidaceae bacterium]
AYTDGLSEARDRHGRFLPVLMLAPAVKADSVDQALDDVLDAVRQHVPRGQLADDLAVMLLENVAGRPAVPAATEAAMGVTS